MIDFSSVGISSEQNETDLKTTQTISGTSIDFVTIHIEMNGTPDLPGREEQNLHQ
jgi:hypothetical protein